MATVSPTQSNVQEAVRNFLLAVLPLQPSQVVAGQQNRAAEPQQGDFVVITPMAFARMETNLDQSADVKFAGSITGNVLTVSDLFFGEVVPGATLFGTGVVVGTRVGAALGTAGGQFQVSVSQVAAPQTMASGATSVTQGAQVTVQLDFHSQNTTDAGDMAQTVSTLLRDSFGCDFFAALPPPLNGVTPLYADDPRQAPYWNENQQVEWRFVLQAEFFINQTTVVPQQFADAVDVDVVSVLAEFPP